jgi:hypothetical protein
MRQLATAGLQLAAATMTRTRIIRRCKRAKFTLSPAYQQICSSPAATASRRRSNDLGTTIEYLQYKTIGAAGIGLVPPISETKTKIVSIF